MSYAEYKASPAEHIKLAEKYAGWADDDRVSADTPWRQMNATLAVAHAQIAQAQMMGRQRA
jgi:hypothetical protein